MIAVSRFAWLFLLAPLACFSEGDVESSDGESTQGDSAPSTSAASETASTTTEPSSSSDGSTSTITTGVDGSESEGSTTGTSPDTSTSDSGDSGELCPGESVEIPPPPIGWDGVFTLSPPPLDDRVPECPPDLVSHGVAIVDAHAEECTCACDPQCFVTGDTAQNCPDPTEPFAVPNASCINVDGAVPPVYLGIDESLFVNDQCPAPNATPVIEGERHTVCEHTNGTPCVPAPMGFSAPCVRHDGDVDCPAGPYSEKVLTVDALQAECAPCESCMQAAIDACTAGTLTLYDDVDCTGNAAVASSNTCSPEAGISFRLDFELACTPTAATPGAASNLRTYCCVP